MNSLFCRHNRFTADCPICSKGTVLDSARQAARPSRASAPSRSSGGGTRTSRRGSEGSGVRRVTGPYVSAGPYERDGTSAEVRLERVPGGVRLAEWSAGTLQPRAPVLEPDDLAAMIAGLRERELLPERDVEALERAVAAAPGGPMPAREEPFGASGGSAGLMREELRVERLDDGRVRVARWILRPSHGWERQE
ncbi:MAG: hypothetical protein ACJ77M_13455, partial [Thermoleophilaceae bacterium]